MKTLIATSLLIALLVSGVSVMAQTQNEDYLGLPGDNLNLFAVMKLFQESKTLEEFERTLNDENSRINNLDLNNDNYIDYISVFDNVYGDVHNIVLQVAINEREKQDVAVFTVERDKKGNVILQLTGDRALYGDNYIIEPNYDDTVINETPNPGYTGNARTVNGRKVNVVRTTVVEVATWPLVTYIYSPGYVVWRSSWYWGYYPQYWSPWRPYYWHYYYGYHYNYYDYYYSYYRPWNYHRHTHWNDYYYRTHHVHSTTVNVYIRDGRYKPTYSRPEERAKGEALYASTHRDSPTRRTESVRVADQNRRSSSGEATRNSSTGSAGVSDRRSSGTTTAKSRSNSETRSSGNTSPQVRPAESKSRESSTRSAAPERKTAQPQAARSQESSTRSAAPERKTAQPQAARSQESSTRSAAPERKTVQPQAARSQQGSPKATAPEKRMPQSQASAPRAGSSSKSSAPARKEAKAQPSQSRSRESKSNDTQARSKESSTKKENSRR
jgi:hypothetical protein